MEDKIMKFIKSISFAINGLKICFQTQTNFKIELFIAAITILLSINFHISFMEWLFVSICIMGVLTLELLNTAIETLCNMVTKNFHPGIKMVKDVSAAAVLVVSVASLVIGLFIFIPKIIVLIQTFFYET
jgi:diacylglycerol kinase